MTMTLLQQVLNWWLFSCIISANLFALLFHILLINDVRMTAFTHQQELAKHQRRKSRVRVRTFQLQCYVWQYRSRFRSKQCTWPTISRAYRYLLTVFRNGRPKLRESHRPNWEYVYVWNSKYELKILRDWFYGHGVYYWPLYAACGCESIMSQANVVVVVAHHS